MRSVTTIIAHKDYLQYLPKAVKSAVGQVGNFKHRTCVIDDGSDANRDDIVSAVFQGAKALPEMVKTIEGGTLMWSPTIELILLDKNGGPSRARNMGVKQNKDSDAFQILDADDEMMFNKIEKCLKVMETNWDDIGIVYGDYLIKKEDGSVVYEFKKPYDKALLQRECIIHSGSLVNANVFRTVGLYDESLRVCEDYNLWLRASARFMAMHIPEPLTVVLDHAGNSTNTVDKSIWTENYKRAVSK